ncbi:MAG: 3-phosphoshikimate 1-carboxyvinyltransferase [Planctomycetes bacterium]|nr:3-phosphoshikimate 1-carboxyvinyltransferase [Planctomycetota bacterium]
MIDYTLPLDQLPDPLPIEPLSKPFDVTITPPGSKSITCRAYVLAALADGESKIIRPLRADDTDKLLDALCTLGAEARWDGEDVYIKGVNGRFPRGGEVNLGDGGAPTRFMIACACLAAEPVVVDGSNRMRERPIAEGVDMLRKLGAKIEYVQEDGRLPVRVVPSEDFKGGEIEIGETTSSQFISALMLVAPWLTNGLTIKFLEQPTSELYLHLTYQTLSEWDVTVPNCLCEPELSISIESGADSDVQMKVEPDASSAVYWITAAAMTGSKSKISGLPFLSQQADVYVAKRMQPQVFSWRSGAKWAQDVSWPVEGSTLTAIERNASDFPDGSMALIVAVSCADACSTLTGLHTLRHKETDRIAALANELRRIGCTIETTDDSITIDPSTRHDEPVVIETYNDHRMAMSFAVLGLARPGISIKNPSCVSKSYPTFWQDFAKLYQ